MLRVRFLNTVTLCKEGSVFCFFTFYHETMSAINISLSSATYSKSIHFFFAQFPSRLPAPALLWPLHTIYLRLHNHEPPAPRRQLHLADIYHYYSRSWLAFIWQCFGGSLHLLSTRHYLSVSSGQGWIEKVRWVWASEGASTPTLYPNSAAPTSHPLAFSVSFLYLPVCTFLKKTYFWYIKTVMDLPLLASHSGFLLTCWSWSFFLCSSAAPHSNTLLCETSPVIIIIMRAIIRIIRKLQFVRSVFSVVCVNILAFERSRDYSLFGLWGIGFDCRAANQRTVRMGLWFLIRTPPAEGLCFRNQAEKEALMQADACWR